MAKKRVAKKVTEAFPASVILEIKCKKDVVQDIATLIEPDGNQNVFRLDQLIGMPAFVEEGVEFDHPRSKEAWMVHMRNTYDERLPIWGYTVAEEGEAATVFIGMDMTVHIPVVSKLGDQRFGLVEAMSNYFGADCKLSGCWKLTNAEGQSIYGYASLPGVIQEQTESHTTVVPAIFEKYGKKQLTSEEVANA
ncbi:Uncharacterised protein [Ectopseudomonas mendocina]|uniref:Uncharacterized protein n=1 Tax=Ectopseudomonas mendocina TaxID=300 RepID=A0A379PNE5_ECTME|nr:hypothetical protein [Pseudomonas mendocina]SUE95886.1 Uncharacterised protein [Pseudomonas mendocina]